MITVTAPANRNKQAKARPRNAAHGRDRPRRANGGHDSEFEASPCTVLPINRRGSLFEVSREIRRIFAYLGELETGFGIQLKLVSEESL